MCGICGIAYLDGEHPVAETEIRRMMQAQWHRGPDDDGCYCVPGVGLGFLRLAIMDLTPAGHQPMTNEDGTVWLTFNGEIYNFQELVPVLERAGHQFRSRSDSEVIIHAYEEWGADCLKRFNGMFAFAIWDLRQRRLLIARDRLGVKPLYYWSDGVRCAWASELKSLLALPWLPRDLNMQALHAYLMYEYVPAPHSIIAGVRKLLPGHYLELPLHGQLLGSTTADLQPRQYWNVQFQSEPESGRSVDDYAQELRSLLKAAVARRLISDVPLGVFLSGGLDSSSVVALMREVSSERPKTFSIGFDEKTFNELHYAQLVAKHFDTDHHVEIMHPHAGALVQMVADYLDEPFADASALPTYLVSRSARRQVTVALGGDAGDELFAGYDWYRAQKLAACSLDRLPQGLRSSLRHLAELIPPSAQKKGMANIARRMLSSVALPPHLQHLRWQMFWSSTELASLLNSSLLTNEEEYIALFAESGSKQPLDQQQYLDIKRYLPDDILFKVDRMSMAVSLEVRGPFLDYTLVEFAARLPASLRLRGMDGKYLLKRAMRETLPAQILHRPKLGFNIPYKNWLRQELRDLVQDALAPQRLSQQGLFQPEYVQCLLQEHLSGRFDHAHRLWQLLMFQLWHERFATQRICTTVPSTPAPIMLP